MRCSRIGSKNEEKRIAVKKIMREKRNGGKTGKKE